MVPEIMSDCQVRNNFLSKFDPHRLTGGDIKVVETNNGLEDTDSDQVGSPVFEGLFIVVVFGRHL